MKLILVYRIYGKFNVIWAFVIENSYTKRSKCRYMECHGFLFFFTVNHDFISSDFLCVFWFCYIWTNSMLNSVNIVTPTEAPPNGPKLS